VLEMRRRRVVFLLTTMVAALVTASGVALAVNKVCPSGTTSSNPCKGTAKTNTSSGNDTLIGTPGTDYIVALSGNDKISAGAGNDTTNGGSGNDTYSYRDGMGTDSVVDASGTDTLNFAAMSSGIRASLYPGNTSFPANWVNDSSFARLVTVSSDPGNVIEKVVGSASGDDFIQTGEAANILQPGPGPGGATLIDLGGCDSSNVGNPPDCGNPPNLPVPVSNDTYSGFLAGGYGAVRISDLGGTADKLILPFASTDAYFEASDSDGNGSLDSLLIMSTSTDSVSIFGQLVPYLGRAGHIETIQFTDGNFSIGSASATVSSTASSSDTSQVDALNAASTLSAAKKEELTKAAKKILSKAKNPLTDPEYTKPPKK
jgi:Ca2+-binding RTX toxin-like protein